LDSESGGEWSKVGWDGIFEVSMSRYAGRVGPPGRILSRTDGWDGWMDG
jgi:hypothetical protein